MPSNLGNIDERVAIAQKLVSNLCTHYIDSVPKNDENERWMGNVKSGVAGSRVRKREQFVSCYPLNCHNPPQATAVSNTFGARYSQQSEPILYAVQLLYC